MLFFFVTLAVVYFYKSRTFSAFMSGLKIYLNALYVIDQRHNLLYLFESSMAHREASTLFRFSFDNEVSSKFVCCYL